MLVRVGKKKYLPLDTIFEACNEAGYEYEPVDSIRGNGPSENFRIKGAKGTFGVIHPVSAHFVIVATDSDLLQMVILKHVYTGMKK